MLLKPTLFDGSMCNYCLYMQLEWFHAREIARKWFFKFAAIALPACC